MYGKIGDGGLTGGANRAIVMVKGLRNPRNSGRCLRHGGDLRIKIATALYFAGLREPACESTSGASIAVFLTPYQARSFCVLRKHSESGNSNDQSNRRSTCTAISSRRNFNSSPDGSNSAVSTPEADAGAANANSENSPIPPVRLRSRSKSTRSTRRSTTRSSRSICSVHSFMAGRTQKTHCARIREGGRSEQEKNHMAGRRLVSDRRGGIRRRFPDDGPMSGK